MEYVCGQDTKAVGVAQVVGPREARVCIVAPGSRRPARLLPSDTPALSHEWLLSAAETVSLPTVSANHKLD